MSSSRRRGRRVPPKHGARPFPPPPSGAGPAPVAGSASGGAADDDAAASAAARTLTRSQNRAAKRAASGVQTKRVRGRTSGRKRRGYNPAILGLAVAAVVVVAAVFLIGNPFGSPSASASPSAAPPFGDGTCPTSQPPALAADATRYVTIDTDLGDIVIKVDGALSPIAAGNVIALAECQYYDGVPFHRTATMEDGTPFVIQGGDGENFDGTGGPGYTIQDEPVTTAYKRGTVAMARTSQPNSQGSQFFIVLDDKAAAPLVSANTYAIFGEVIAGMDVADAIYKASNGEQIPADPVIMNTVTVSETPPPSPAASVAPSAAASVAPSGAASAPPTEAPTSTP